MTSPRLVAGFDYKFGKPLSHTMPEWRVRLRDVVKAGGFRRVENGETFAHGKDGLLLFEVYARVNV